MEWNSEFNSLLTKNKEKWLVKKNGVSDLTVSRYLREDSEDVPFDMFAVFAKSLGVDKEMPYNDIKAAIIRSRGKLTPTEKSSLLALLLATPTKER